MPIEKFKNEMEILKSEWEGEGRTCSSSGFEKIRIRLQFVDCDESKQKNGYMVKSKWKYGGMVGIETLIGFINSDGIIKLSKITPSEPRFEPAQIYIKFLDSNTVEYQFIESASDISDSYSDYVILKRIN
jgi:hypothetical protein